MRSYKNTIFCIKFRFMVISLDRFIFFFISNFNFVAYLVMSILGYREIHETNISGALKVKVKGTNIISDWL